MNRPPTMIAIALSLLVAFSTNAARKKRAPKRRSEVIGYLTKLEQGLFGERELIGARRLLKRSKDYERSWLVVVIAQYHRVMEKDPQAALLYLAPDALGEASAKKWLKKLKDAESRRKSKWVQAKADAYREKRETPEEPTGLAIPFPPASELKPDYGQ